MKKIYYLGFLAAGILFTISCNEVKEHDTSIQLVSYDHKPVDKLIFYGTEPFWELSIKNGAAQGFIINDSLENEKIVFFQKTDAGSIHAFSNASQTFWGVIEHDPWNGCSTNIEEEIYNWNIYFVYNNRTYRGCGIEKSK